MSNKPTPIDITHAEHYVWGDICDGWHLLKLPDLSVIQERVPPNAGETNHIHSTARQFFYVLNGQACIEFDTDRVTLNPGQGVHVPPGTNHRFVNRSSKDVVFLVISSPSTAGDRTNLAPA